MAGIRSTQDIAKKFLTVTPQRAAQYEEGVRNPLRDYAQGAAAANDAWKGGVTAAVAGDRFKTGVLRSGTAKWQEKAIQLGPSRFSSGVQASGPAYEQGFNPYRESIARAVLPPRGPRRSPQNRQRVDAVVLAMSATKEALLKGGK